jgi:hypothetical protein
LHDLTFLLAALVNAMVAAGETLFVTLHVRRFGMIRTAIASAMTLLAAAYAPAATIVSYNLQGQPGSQVTQAPALSAANTTGVNMTRGPGVTPNAGSNSFNSAGWESAIAAPASTEYVEFGFVVDAGYTVDLEQLFIGTRSSGTGPGTIGLFSSIDAYAAPIASWAAGNAVFVNQVVNLSSLPDVAGDVRFRLYEVGNSSANGGTTASTGTFRVTAYFVGGVFDRDLQLTGTVTAIPEASSLVFGAIAVSLAGVAVIRRRGKNA